MSFPMNLVERGNEGSMGKCDAWGDLMRINMKFHTIFSNKMDQPKTKRKTTKLNEPHKNKMGVKRQTL